MFNIKDFNKRIEFCDGCYNDIIIDFGIDFDRYGGVIVDFCVVYIQFVYFFFWVVRVICKLKLQNINIRWV